MLKIGDKVKVLLNDFAFIAIIIRHNTEFDTYTIDAVEGTNFPDTFKDQTYIDENGYFCVHYTSLHETV